MYYYQSDFLEFKVINLLTSGPQKMGQCKIKNAVQIEQDGDKWQSQTTLSYNINMNMKKHIQKKNKGKNSG